mgnify:CR=1 FL=1
MLSSKCWRAASSLVLALGLHSAHTAAGSRSLLDHERLIGWGGEKHSQTDDTCHVMSNTELAGDVVLWGANNKVDTADHCCSMCNKVRTAPTVYRVNFQDLTVYRGYS